MIGISGYAGVLLRLFHEAEARGQLKFAAAVVRNPKKDQAAYDDLVERGVRIYPSFEELLEKEADQLDLLCVPTGISTHAPLTIAAVEAGLDVFVEKPLAGSIEECDRIIAAEESSGRFVAVGFQDLYAPMVLQLKDKLLAGDIGDIQEIKCFGIWPRGYDYYGRTSWAGKAFVEGVQTLDSPMMNAFGHYPHMLLYLAGHDKMSSARVKVEDAQLLRAHDIETYDTAVVRAVSESGIRFWFGVSHAAAAEVAPEIRIKGTKGEVVWKYEDSCVIQYADGTEEALPSYTAFDARDKLVEHAAKRVSDPSVFVSTAAMAREHTRLVADIHFNFPVTVVPEGEIDILPINDGADKVPAIRGIVDDMRAAFIVGGPLKRSQLTEA